ncbi:MAG: biotin/lipoate A/B protein ligase family protein [Chloroflexota bacterium]
MTAVRWRLIRSTPMSGPENMALDEAILESVSSGASPPTLRLYAWNPPCLSLGYAQVSELVDLEKLQDLGWDLVRRPTGGKAILHTDELTYSVAGLIRDPLFSGGVLASYKRLSAGLMRALQDLGLDPELRVNSPDLASNGDSPVCFEVPGAYEITWAGKKLLGSAQLRRARAVLQHGSLPLEGDIARISRVLRLQDREQASRSVRQAAATVEQALGQRVSWEQVAAAVVSGFRKALDLELVEDQPSPAELVRSRELRDERYGRFEWTYR